MKLPNGSWSSLGRGTANEVVHKIALWLMVLFRKGCNPQGGPRIAQWLMA